MWLAFSNADIVDENTAGLASSIAVLTARAGLTSCLFQARYAMLCCLFAAAVRQRHTTTTEDEATTTTTMAAGSCATSTRRSASRRRRATWWCVAETARRISGVITRPSRSSSTRRNRTWSVFSWQPPQPLTATTPSSSSSSKARIAALTYACRQPVIVRLWRYTQWRRQGEGGKLPPLWVDRRPKIM